nr:ATP-binding protein [uncultured Acidocella sp.]
MTVELDTAADALSVMMSQSSISVWQEDWSAVAGFIRELRASGDDPVAYCTAQPETCQALHARVRIYDVNEPALLMMRADDKAQLLGGLSKVLPYSVFTFPLWLAAIARGERSYRGEAVVRRLDGTLCECLISAMLPAALEDLSRISVLVIDTASYRGGTTILDTLQHASRLAAMGVLTASIAHEVKNPLAAIMTNADACRRWLRQPSPNLGEAEEAIRAIVRDAIRARDVVERTLAFLRPAPSGQQEIDIVNLINGAIVLIMSDLRGYDVEIEFLPDERLPHGYADPIQVQQVLINLMLNASQAMAAQETGRLISIRAREAAEEIVIEVADQGPGLRPEQFSRLFEPFYSSKQGGIGMGLAVSRACVEANGGRIWAENRRARGARFCFTLNPAANG